MAPKIHCLSIFYADEQSFWMSSKLVIQLFCFILFVDIDVLLKLDLQTNNRKQKHHMTAYPNLFNCVIFEHEVPDIASQWKVMQLSQINIHELMLLHCCDIGWLHFSKHSDSNALKNKKTRSAKLQKAYFSSPG